MRRFLFLVLTLAGLTPFVAVAAPVPQGKEAREPFWALPWGIASEDGKTAYVTSLDGKVYELTPELLRSLGIEDSKKK